MIEQIAIALFGLTAVVFTQVKNKKLNKWACIFGMMSQPFWIYSAVSNELWGILALTLFYTFAWGLGVYNNWIKKN